MFLVKNLFEVINVCCDIDLYCFIFVFGIWYVGEGNVKLLVWVYGFWVVFYDVMKVVCDYGNEVYVELNDIDGIGYIVVDVLVEFFVESYNCD